jgi:hypothetical protein
VGLQRLPAKVVVKTARAAFLKSARRRGFSNGAGKTSRIVKMFAITSVLESRSVDGGHAIEIDFGLDDASTHTLKIPYEHIPRIVHAITSALSVAETAQKSTGERTS